VVNIVAINIQSQRQQQGYNPPAAKDFSFAETIVPSESDAPQGYYQNSQNDYMIGCANICNGLISLLSSASPPSFEELLIWVGKERREIAHGHGSESFGVLRDHSIYGKLTTDLRDQYAPLIDDLQSMAEDDPNICWEFYDAKPDGYNVGIRIASTEMGPVELSKYIFCRMSNDHAAIGHANGENLKIASAVCSALYQEILNLKPADTETIQTKIAEFHWWLAQACFFKRASASCAEIKVAALSHHKKIPLTPYVKGVFPDRIALVTSLEQFVQLYPSFRL
jgi:hypothetical protein